MSLESFFNHPLLIWEWLVWVFVIGVLRFTIAKVWKKGQQKGREDYDQYKKWESIFKEEGRFKK